MNPECNRTLGSGGAHDTFVEGHKWNRLVVYYKDGATKVPDDLSAECKELEKKNKQHRIDGWCDLVNTEGVEPGRCPDCKANLCAWWTALGAAGAPYKAKFD